MSNSFERMWSRLPDVLKSPDTEKFYRCNARIFDTMEKEHKNYIYSNVFSKVNGELLDLFGLTFDIGRNGENDTEYRRRIKIEMAKLNFIPTLDNFINFITKITGYGINITEGWKLDNPRKALLTGLITIPAGNPSQLLFDLEKLYSCGVKLEFALKQESYTPFELVGNHNDTGLTKIYNDYKINIEE
ncbi:MAG: hypothetical protein ACRC0F_04120 [Cetobacterium sp.]